jgi:hypothetical protein
MQAATNTSDAFHRVVPWLFLGEAGNIASKDRATQRKPITYNHLIANGVLFHDMHAQTRLFHPPAHEGHAVDQGVLAHLSPDLTARVNRVGSYTVKCGRQVPSPN